MPFVHVVLLKVKTDIWEIGNGKKEFVEKLEDLREVSSLLTMIDSRCLRCLDHFDMQLSIVKELEPELAWGPPVYADRSKEFNYGLYTKFKNQTDFEKYRDDAGHRDFVKALILPNTDEVMAYDLDY